MSQLPLFFTHLNRYRLQISSDIPVWLLHNVKTSPIRDQYITARIHIGLLPPSLQHDPAQCLSQSIEHVTQPMTICSLCDSALAEPRGRQPADKTTDTPASHKHPLVYSHTHSSACFCNFSASMLRASRHMQQPSQLIINKCKP